MAIPAKNRNIDFLKRVVKKIYATLLATEFSVYGKAHDGRAPDYDDWSTETPDNRKGLNGDIVLWNPILKRAFEISSMGIRVNREALLRQLKIRGTEERKELNFHKRLINGDFPDSIGGGIGQSRLCMFFLRKAHIGELQASLWPDDLRKKCSENNIFIM